MDRSTDEAADPTARNEGSNWLMELFKHMYAGYMFGTQAEPGMANLGTEQYAPLPADQRQANAGLQRYVPGLSYTQGQVDALSRKYSLDYAPHDLVGAAGRLVVVPFRGDVVPGEIGRAQVVLLRRSFRRHPLETTQGVARIFQKPVDVLALVFRPPARYLVRPFQIS
jgi:hypothetical protein